MTDAPHTPRLSACPACRYDMTGAPSPICPECGIDAVAEHARREQLRAKRLQRAFTWPPETILVLAFVYALSQQVSRRSYHWHAHDPAFHALVGVWTLGGVWLWHRRTLVLVQAHLAWISAYVALVILSAVMALDPRWPWDDRYDLRSMVGVLAVSTCLTTCLWVCTSGRSWRAILLLFGLVVAAPGVALTLAAEGSIAAGGEWSCFSDPRPGQIHAQYPLRWDEVRAFTPRILLTGAAFIAASLTLRKRAETTKGSTAK